MKLKQGGKPQGAHKKGGDRAYSHTTRLGVRWIRNILCRLPNWPQKGSTVETG